jgi:translation initiation factor 2 subunit 1
LIKGCTPQKSTMDSIKFYAQEAPAQGDVVIVKVTKVTEVGVYAKLLEYPGFQGLILLSEMSKRRIRSMAQLTRVGKLESCVVVRVDVNTKQVDISKRQVTLKDSEKAMERFHKTKQVLALLLQISNEVRTPVERLVETLAYPLLKDQQHPLDVFEMISRGKEFREFYSNEEYTSIDSNIIIKLAELIKKKLLIKPHYIRADVNCMYSGAEGIEMLKAAFRVVESAVKVRYMSAPKYIFETMNTDIEEGTCTINESIAAVKAYLEAKGGNVSIAEPARVMGEVTKQIDAEEFDESDSTTSELHEEGMNGSHLECVEDV